MFTTSIHQVLRKLDTSFLVIKLGTNFWVMIIMSIINITCIVTTEAIANASEITPIDTANATTTTKQIKLVSLSPEITEILGELNALDMLVGIDSNSTYPKETNSIPKIADYYTVNIERLVVLKPDYVFLSKGWNSHLVTYLDKTETHIGEFDFTTVDNLFANILTIGKLVNKEKEAKELVASLKLSYQNTISTYAKFPLKKSIIIIWGQPLMVAGGNNFFNSILSICHAKNIFEESVNSYPIISNEKIALANPDIIISLTDQTDKIQLINRDKLVIFKNNDILNRVTPRTLTIGIPELCQMIHK